MRAENFLCFSSGGVWGEDLVPVECMLLLSLRGSVIVLCFVVRYFMSILVLQSSWWGRESWLLAWFVSLVSRDG